MQQKFVEIFMHCVLLCIFMYRSNCPTGKKILSRKDLKELLASKIPWVWFLS